MKHKSMHVEKHTKYEKQISSKIPRNSPFQDHIVDLCKTLEAAKEDEGSIGSKGSRTLHVENIRRSFFRRK